MSTSTPPATGTGTNRRSDVAWRVDGALGHVTLDRPRAMNALTLDMVLALHRALDELEAHPRVRVVLLDGAGDRGFCAGGDVVALRDAAISGDPMPREFWAQEYRLNARIARFRVPVVAVMDGVVMGGGIGLAGHASHRIATETLLCAMPEVGIGFVPDVGGTWLLSRGPGELGTHLALTGARIGARDAVTVGLADHVVARSALGQLEADLRAGDVDAAIERATGVPVKTDDGTLDGDRGWIDAAYAHDTVPRVLAALRERPETGAGKAADAIDRASPTALAVTLAALRRSRGLASLERALQQEHRTSCAFLAVPDFVEGIRAQLVDKDRTPRWDPPRHADVDDDLVARCFAPTADDLELTA